GVRGRTAGSPSRPLIAVGILVRDEPRVVVTRVVPTDLASSEVSQVVLEGADVNLPTHPCEFGRGISNVEARARSIVPVLAAEARLHGCGQLVRELIGRHERCALPHQAARRRQATRIPPLPRRVPVTLMTHAL